MALLIAYDDHTLRSQEIRRFLEDKKAINLQRSVWLLPGENNAWALCSEISVYFDGSDDLLVTAVDMNNLYGQHSPLSWGRVQSKMRPLKSCK